MAYASALRKGTDIPEPAKPEPASPGSRTELKHNRPLFDYYIVLDFEATCEKDVRLRDQEIIEFPSVLVDAHSTAVVSEFQRYVRPVRRPELSAFCTELTGIQQSTVSAAQTFPEVFAEYQAWVASGNMGMAAPQKSFAFVTCGDWDLKTMLPNQLGLIGERNCPPYFGAWINLKKVFQDVTGKKANGMPDMLNYYSKPLLGHHHSGIDDCRNISTVLIAMLRQGKKVDFTWLPRGEYKHWNGEPAPAPPASLVTAPLTHTAGGDDLTTPPAASPSPPQATHLPQATSRGFDSEGNLLVDESRDAVTEILTAKPARGMSPGEAKTISKRLSWALRHGIEELGLQMSRNGWVSLDAVISHPRFKQLDFQSVAQMVKSNDKQRFALAYAIDGLAYIRANQGHSIANVQIDMKPVTDVSDLPFAVHGTKFDAWQFIKTEGLNKMARQHIHMAKGLPGDKEVISGMRKSSEVIVYVDLAALLRDAVPLFESKNGVILSPGVDGVIHPRYFNDAIDAKTGASLLR